MDIKDITTWTVRSDHKATPKNPYSEYISLKSPLIGAFAKDTSFSDFETFATQHTYHCSPSLVAGEYPVEMVELVKQVKDKLGRHNNGKWMTIHKFKDILLDNRYEQRQYLQLKQPLKELQTTNGRFMHGSDISESKEVESVPVKSGEITTIDGKKFPLAKNVKNQNGLKADIIDLVLNLAAPDDDCMLSDFLHALQFILDKHAPVTNHIEVIKDRIKELVKSKPRYSNARINELLIVLEILNR